MLLIFTVRNQSLVFLQVPGMEFIKHFEFPVMSSKDFFVILMK